MCIPSDKSKQVRHRISHHMPPTSRKISTHVDTGRKMRPSNTAQDSDAHARRASRIHFCSAALWPYIELRRRNLHERHSRDVPHKHYTESHTPARKPGVRASWQKELWGGGRRGMMIAGPRRKHCHCASFCCALCRRRRSCGSRTCA
jgi:hypothetical protein